MELGVSLDLPCDESESSVDKQGVLLPLSWVVVGLSIDGLWDGVDGRSSHFVS